MRKRNDNRQADSLQQGMSVSTTQVTVCTASGNLAETGRKPKAGRDGCKGIAGFLQASEISTRQCVYIDRETHGKIAFVVSRLGNGLSIGKFVDNILCDHLREYRAQYNQAIENAKTFRL